MKEPTGAGTSTPGMVRFLRGILDWENPSDAGLRARIRAVIRAYLHWNRNLLLDPWMRYHPVVSMLTREHLPTSTKILDVGSGNAGLAFFLQHPVVGVDLKFSGDQRTRYPSPLLPIIGSVTHLPFRDEAFDVVVSMDTLEHVPRNQRAQAVREIFRVARRKVIVGFPFGPESAEFDSEALRAEQARGILLDWREEHVRHGVPGAELHEELLKASRGTSPGMAVSWFPQEGIDGLRLRWRLQELVPRDSRIYGLVFYGLYWLHARGKPRRAYRRVYVAGRPQVNGKGGD